MKKSIADRIFSMIFEANELLEDEEYTCYECGAKMKEVGDVLVCPDCKWSIDKEDYQDEEDRDDDRYYNPKYFPTKEEVTGEYDDEE